MVTLSLHKGNKITRQELHTAGWALADLVHTQIKREAACVGFSVGALKCKLSQPKPKDDYYVKLFDVLY
jgi:hypothetical protein